LITSWNPVPIGIGTVYSAVISSLVVSEGSVYVGGEFDNIGGESRKNIAAIDTATGLVTSWNPNSDHVVYTLAVSNGVVYVGGMFWNIGGQLRPFVAAIDAVTGLATSWNPGLNSLVNALAVKEGIVYVGGEFTQAGGQTRYNVAAIGATTGQATSWNPDPDDTVYALAADDAGSVYAGGIFSTLNFGTSNWEETLQFYFAQFDPCLTEAILTPDAPIGPVSGNPGISYTYSASGSSSNLGHSVQYIFDWGDGTNSGWLPVSTYIASKSWNKTGTYVVKAQARCATHTSVVSGWSQGLTINITSPITLQSPSDGAIFNSCTLITKNQPAFSWTVAETFASCSILFSTSPTDFTTRGFLITKASVRAPANTWTPSSSVWKKVMSSSSQNGEIYWRVIGTRPNRTTAESESWSFSIGPPQLVTINAPTGGPMPAAIPPTFDFNTNCNVKFKLEISSVGNFSDSTKIKSFNYTTRDPNIDQRLIKTLSSFQWNSIKKLIGTGTGHFRIKAWDGINRESVSETRSFTIQQ
jgi:hypothetical protein